ncbi:hypothetical protein OG216_19210 [Streptomycetaceae bacterium NBC_01309]
MTARGFLTDPGTDLLDTDHPVPRLGVDGVVEPGMTLPPPRDRRTERALRRRLAVSDPETPIFNALAAEWSAGDRSVPGAVSAPPLLVVTDGAALLGRNLPTARD